MDDLAYLSALEALAMFRIRELSPVELLDAVIARDEAVGADINAFAWRFSDAARAEAKHAEDRYMGNGPAPRPLEGIPVAIKENQAIAGQPLTNASLLAADTIASGTAPLPQRVLDAGGIVHARTTMSEFGTHWATHSRLFGITRNPWNCAYDVGGSSGGSAAALAAGTTTLATGGDFAGSIRTPAACCGVVGYKPPYGRVPVLPTTNFDTYLSQGPMARTVADCALILEVIAGPHPNDIVSLRDPVALPREQGSLRGWKVALSLDLGSWQVSPEVQTNTLAVADALSAAGAEVEEVALDWDPRELTEAIITHFVVRLQQLNVTWTPEQRSQFSTYAANYFAPEPLLPPGQVERGLQLEAKIYAVLGSLLERYRVLICSTLTIPAIPAGVDQPDRLFDTENWTIVPGFAHVMGWPFNICNRCPVLAVPSGIGANGIPTGIQIVGRTHADVDVFRVGMALERERPWLDVPARRPRLPQAEALEA
jgi:aspartyl-tRNA(Asn)/glutamyl-tRNA(Gln) amidotransferase subunit A